MVNLNNVNIHEQEQFCIMNLYDQTFVIWLSVCVVGGGSAVHSVPNVLHLKVGYL